MKRTIVADPRWDLTNITTKTSLTRNVSVGRFIGSTALSSLTDEEKVKLVRQLYFHAEMMELVSHLNQFSQYSLQITEAYPTETVDTIRTYGFSVPPIDQAKREGKTVVYSLIDTWGHTNVAANFELASFLKDHILYDDIVLDYDSYDPRGIIHAQIIVTFPEISETFEGDFNFRVQTWFNGMTLSDTDLMEVQI